MKTKTILIVDDDPQFVSAIAKRCQRIGLKVQYAHNALTALEIMEERLPDLVCLDVEMPTGNGLSICEMMASDITARKIPVIVLTGRRDPETVLRCRDLFAYYVHKSGSVWPRLEAVIYELIDIEPPKASFSACTENNQ